MARDRHCCKVKRTRTKIRMTRRLVLGPLHIYNLTSDHFQTIELPKDDESHPRAWSNKAKLANVFIVASMSSKFSNTKFFT